MAAVLKQSAVSACQRKRGADMEQPMTLDSIFWIALYTKMISGVAAMQLCEQGKLSLDDPDKVDERGPELKTIRILRQVDEHGKPELVDKTKRITMKMLLTHTGDWGQPLGCDEFSGHPNNVLGQPLVFEPGTDWQYGPTCTTKTLTGQSENEITHLDDLSSSKAKILPRLVAVLERAASLDQPSIAVSRLRETDRDPLLMQNSGISPTTQNRILSDASIEEMFTNQIPQSPDFGRNGMYAAEPDLTNPIPELYPQPPEQPQGWCISK
ncbi:MAG: hypothetical protein Q9197_005274 [Variospora fuerteventurae]